MQQNNIEIGHSYLPGNSGCCSLNLGNLCWHTYTNIVIKASFFVKNTKILRSIIISCVLFYFEWPVCWRNEIPGEIIVNFNRVYYITLPILNITFIPHFLFIFMQFYFLIFFMMMQNFSFFTHSDYIRALVRICYLLLQGYKDVYTWRRFQEFIVRGEIKSTHVQVLERWLND